MYGVRCGRVNFVVVSRIIPYFAKHVKIFNQDALDPVEKFICTLSLVEDPSASLIVEVYYKDLNDNVPVFVNSLPTNIDITEVGRSLQSSPPRKKTQILNLICFLSSRPPKPDILSSSL